jgi:SAM-dependent methyltransferase
MTKRLMEALLRRRAARLVRFMMPELPAVGPILDVGSGTGHNAECLAGISRLPVIEADVVDIHAIGRGPVLFDGRMLPFDNAEFSASILLFVLQYASDPESLLSEIRRVTAGPVMVLQSSYRGRIGHFILRAREVVTGRLAFFVCRWLGLVSATTCALHPRRFFTGQNLENVFAAAGFRVRAIRRFDRLITCVSRDLYILEPMGPCP